MNVFYPQLPTKPSSSIFLLLAIFIIREAQEELTRLHPGSSAQEREDQAWTRYPILALGLLSFDPNPGPSSPPMHDTPRGYQPNYIRGSLSLKNHCLKSSAAMNDITTETEETGKQQKAQPSELDC